MKYAREFVTSTVIGGLFIVVPVYLAILLLLKGMKSAATLVRPIAVLLPDWMPAEGLVSLLLVLVVCFIVGAAVRTRSRTKRFASAWRRRFSNGSRATASCAA